MNKSNSCIGLNDLPDEIILNIFRKLNNIDILYCFQGVNQRLNQIIHDPIFTRHLGFVQWFPYRYVDMLSCDMILNRFSSQILPDIHHQIQQLDLESSSMKRVLSAATYPNLHTLGLCNIDEESARELFTDLDEILSTNIVNTQITTLFIRMDDNDDYYMPTPPSIADILNNIFSVFTNLILFDLYGSSHMRCYRLDFDDEFLFSKFRSSTLLKLYINVQYFNDCLYLLDGRFSQLQVLSVDLIWPEHPLLIKNEGNLPTLRCFSLACREMALCYNDGILPLLHRMSNLEELSLCLKIHVDGPFIDGNHLKSKIINHMPRLNRFSFSINSSTDTCNEMNWLSAEKIQQTFDDIPMHNIAYNLEHYREGKECFCHIYTCPFLFKYYDRITNNFPGGIFYSVRVVSLSDHKPFEPEFFRRIVMSFPFMESLTVRNYKQQQHKQSHNSNNDHRDLSLIHYLRLNQLDLMNVDDDYIEQFLFHSKTYLQNKIILHIKYEGLKRVTHNFTRGATRINCTKISKLHLYDRENRATSVKEYFPCAKICCPFYSF